MSFLAFMALAFRFCLSQFVVTDGLGHGRTVMYSLMRNEKCSANITAFLVFHDPMPNRNRVQTFTVDLSFTQKNAIRTVFQGKNILLCQFHLVMLLQSKNKVVWHLVRRLMKTISIARYSTTCL